MYLKKVLNQPNLVGTVMIALLFGAGFVYAFAFDGFNVEIVTGGEVEALLAQAGDDNSGDDDDDDDYTCGSSDCDTKNWSNCPARGDDASGDCTGCTYKGTYCNAGGPSCSRKHPPKCPCPVSGCSQYNGGQTSCPAKGSKKCKERNKG